MLDIPTSSVTSEVTVAVWVLAGATEVETDVVTDVDTEVFVDVETEVVVDVRVCVRCLLLFCI